MQRPLYESLLEFKFFLQQFISSKLPAAIHAGGMHGASCDMKTFRQRMLRFLTRSLSLHETVILKQSLKPLGMLDHPRLKLQMACDNIAEFGRTRSCEKEPETVSWLELWLQKEPASVFFDVGANVGAYSLAAAGLGGGLTRVFAFEPGAATYASLVKNVELNKFGDLITPVPLALANATRLTTFHYSSTSAGAASHGLDEPTGENSESFTPAFSQQILCMGMDEFISKFQCPCPQLLKIDVDGAELQVLEGAVRTLSDPRLNSVLIELDSTQPLASEAFEKLGAAGLRAVEKHLRRNSTTLANHIFVRP